VNFTITRIVYKGVSKLFITKLRLLIAKAFIKANSTLPSSAAVERLFSTAGMILSPRRCKMTDKLFDQMVFLKCRAKND
jgi:hypothetical protein